MGLEPTTLRLRVSCSTDWASRAAWIRTMQKKNCSNLLKCISMVPEILFIVAGLSLDNAPLQLKAHTWVFAQGPTDISLSLSLASYWYNFLTYPLLFIIHLLFLFLSFLSHTFTYFLKALLLYLTHIPSLSLFLIILLQLLTLPTLYHTHTLSHTHSLTHTLPVPQLHILLSPLFVNYALSKFSLSHSLSSSFVEWGNRCGWCIATLIWGSLDGNDQQQLLIQKMWRKNT